MCETSTSFSEATAVERRPEEPDPSVSASATYDTSIAQGWDIMGNANGGYLLSLVARACALEVGRPDPVSITAHYLSPGRPGVGEVEVSTARIGRRFATADATLRSSDGTEVLRALGTFADLADTSGPERIDASPPDLPPVDDCVGAPPAGGGDAGAAVPPSFMDKVDLRLHPDDAGFGRGTPSGKARVRGWFRFPDGEPVDTIGLLCVLDAFPPTVFNTDLPVAWVPTLEFTGHVRCRPTPGWLACEFSTHIVSGGFLEEDGLVWDSEGRLVAQSRQLALVPRG